MGIFLATADGSSLLFQKQSGSRLTGNEQTEDLMAYEDRMTATTQGGFAYGIGAEGATPNVTVRNESSQVLYSESNHVVNYGSPATHDMFSFSTPLQGQSLTVRFNENMANRFLNGIDNVLFSQVSNSVGVPGDFNLDLFVKCHRY